YPEVVTIFFFRALFLQLTALTVGCLVNLICLHISIVANAILYTNVFKFPVSWTPVAVAWSVIGHILKTEGRPYSFFALIQIKITVLHIRLYSFFFQQFIVLFRSVSCISCNYFRIFAACILKLL